MTKIEDVSRSNEEVENYFKRWYEDKIVQPMVDWIIKEVGKVWLDTKMQSIHFYSMLCFILLDKENKEYTLDYDKYVEFARQLKEDYPKGFYVHGYVKDDNKFHIWLEERTDSNSNLYYDNLFGKHVEVNDE